MSDLRRRAHSASVAWTSHDRRRRLCGYALGALEDAPNADRIAHNEARARELNELIEDERLRSNGNPPYTEWICECGDPACPETVEMSIGEYESVRADPTRFLVVPDEQHVVPEVEHVVSKADRYWVVEKVGEAARVSEARDSRNEDEEQSG